MIDLAKELFESYSILEKTEQSDSSIYEIDFLLPKSLSYFSGHFPQVPVLPAVGILDISFFFLLKILPKESVTKSIKIKKIKKMKIRRPLGPDEKVRLRIKRESDSEFSLLWKNPMEEKNFAEFSLLINQD